MANDKDVRETEEAATAEIDQASGNPPEDDQPKTRQSPPDGWREMKAADLVDLCKRADLPCAGKRAELIKRLDLYYFGSSDRHSNGRVACPYCKSPARCNGTRRISDTLIQRTYRCLGRRRHSFTIDATLTERKD